MKNTVVCYEMTDITLWNLSIEENQKALELLYQKYYPLLLNYGLKCCSDRELIKDCIQDLFINIYGNKRLSCTDITVRAYLLRALRNNMMRKISVQHDTEVLDDLSFHIPTDENLFEQLFPKNDHELLLARRLLKAIAQLSDNQKTVIYLRYVKELSFKEISDIMMVNVQSSMNLASRALSKLRQLMKGDDSEGNISRLLQFALLFSFCRKVYFSYILIINEGVLR